MKTVADGKLLWEPSKEQIAGSNVTKYMNWLNETKGLTFQNYNELWKWSVDELEEFWESIWLFNRVRASIPFYCVLKDRKMPTAQWFQGAKLNYAENVFKHELGKKTALIFHSESGEKREISWEELREKTASVAQVLKNLGVKRGDRVVAYMPNIPEAIIAFLATASIGAVWSSCSPDFGASSVIDRFNQIEPVVLFAVDGYQYNGKIYDSLSVVKQLQTELPTIKNTFIIPFKQDKQQEYPEHTTLWQDISSYTCDLTFEQVPFDHPLWILYSSGTTGLPKAIVQGHGGILLEHLKVIMLQQNLTDEDVFFWYTTTGWMMWNFLIGGLLVGSTAVLYDGSPTYPTIDRLWELIEQSGTTFFGASAGFINACLKSGTIPKDKFDLSKLKGIGSTGSPLTSEGFSWIYEKVKKDLWLVSTSGGTDLCTAFVGGCPILPVHAGELQARALGANVQAFNENGETIINEVGELVITEPMPSMPLYFWNDKDNKRYIESYFDMYPGIWRHGDWIKIDDKGSCIIYGRSDSTINRQGVRLGTSEIYRVVESLEEVVESLVIDLEILGRESYMPLFVVLKQDQSLDDALIGKINEAIRKNNSPRFIPDQIYEIKEIPKTISGKKMEVPVRKLLLGHPPEKVVNKDSMANPDSIHFFIELAQQMNQ